MFGELGIVCGPVPARPRRAASDLVQRREYVSEKDATAIFASEAVWRVQRERMVEFGLRCGRCKRLTGSAVVEGENENPFCSCPEPTGDCPPLSACPTCWRWTHEGCSCARSKPSAALRPKKRPAPPPTPKKQVPRLGCGAEAVVGMQVVSCGNYGDGKVRILYELDGPLAGRAIGLGDTSPKLFALVDLSAHRAPKK